MVLLVMTNVCLMIDSVMATVTEFVEIMILIHVPSGASQFHVLMEILVKEVTA